jgi:hypothetical protein
MPLHYNRPQQAGQSKIDELRARFPDLFVEKTAPVGLMERMRASSARPPSRSDEDLRANEEFRARIEVARQGRQAPSGPGIAEAGQPSMAEMLEAASQPEASRWNFLTDKAMERVGGQVANLPETIANITRGVGQMASQGAESFAADPIGFLGSAAKALPGGIFNLGKDIVSDTAQTLTNPRAAVEERGLLPLLDVAGLIPGVGLGARALQTRQLGKLAGKIGATSGKALVGVPGMHQTFRARRAVLENQMKERLRALEMATARQGRPPGIREGLDWRAGPELLDRRVLEARKAVGEAETALERFTPKSMIETLEAQKRKLDRRERKAGRVSDDLAKQIDNTKGDIKAAEMYDRLVQLNPRSDVIDDAIAIIASADDPTKLVASALRDSHMLRPRGTGPLTKSQGARIEELSGQTLDQIINELPENVVLYPSEYAPMLKTGKDALADLFMPSEEHVLSHTANIGYFKSLLMDPERVVPGLSKILRPAVDAKNLELTAVTKQLDKVIMKGVSKAERERVGLEAGEILVGKHDLGMGHNAAIKNLTDLPDHFHPKSLEVAQYMRKHYDSWFDRLKEKARRGEFNEHTTVAVMKMNKLEDYMPQLQEFMVNELRAPDKSRLMPPDVVRFNDPETFFAFYERNGAGMQQVNANAFTSFRVYGNAAIRKLHMDPAFKELQGLKKKLVSVSDKATDHKVRTSMSNAKDVIQNVESYLQGAPISANDLRLDRAVTALLNSKPLKILGRGDMHKPATRISMSLATNFYRGVLGANVSAAVNNLTQSVNTMAKAGVMPTMRGVMRMMTKQGRAEARAAGLSTEWARIFEGGINKFDEKFLFKMFEKAETINRGIAFHAGSDAARRRLLKQGLRAGDDLDFRVLHEGIEMSNSTQFLYDELARNPSFRTTLGRQVGILTSFPIKQAQFLAQDLTKPQLVKYFAITGAAQLVTEEFLGYQMNAFRPTEVLGTGVKVPGLEFMSQIQLGGPGSGSIPLAMTPGVQLFTTAIDLLRAASTGDTEKILTSGSDFLDSMATLFPAGVQSREIGVAVANSLDSTRRAQRPGIPFVKEFFDIQRARKGTRTADRARPTDIPSEIARLMGATPMEQVRSQDWTGDLVQDTATRNARVARAYEEMERRLITGEGGFEDIAPPGSITSRGLGSSIKSGREPGLLRAWNSVSKYDKMRMLHENPKMVYQMLRELGQFAETDFRNR